MKTQSHGRIFAFLFFQSDLDSVELLETQVVLLCMYEPFIELPYETLE